MENSRKKKGGNVQKMKSKLPNEMKLPTLAQANKTSQDMVKELESRLKENEDTNIVEKVELTQLNSRESMIYYF